MRIAYVSYEHPAGVTGGGIGTYLGQVAGLMKNRGNVVEVFTATKGASRSVIFDGYLVHLVPSNSYKEFRAAVASAFRERHNIIGFEVIETGEFGADGLEIIKKFPEIAVTVKLHTPSYLVSRLNSNLSVIDKLRFVLGGVLRGKFERPFWKYNKESDPEYELFKLADTVSSPSYSLARIINHEWDTNRQIDTIPLIFTPSPELLNMPVANLDEKEVIISFIGKLEKRKGVLDLMGAIPAVLSKHPNVIFRFIGKPLPSPRKGLNMEQYLTKKLRRHEKNLHFTGEQPYENIPLLLKDSPICVFPSIWENFPNVCLESMSAGRAVIGSSNGGMADMIEHKKSGLLVPPASPKDLAAAIEHLLVNAEEVHRLGKAARERVISMYNSQKVGDQIESLYHRTIWKAKSKCFKLPANSPVY